MGKYLLLLASVIALTLGLTSCSKSSDSSVYQLSYGDSILYLRSSGNNIVYPTQHKDGTYSGFPEGIEIDENTGAINLSNSETGLRYRITHTATDGKVTTTMVVLSGITFPDHFFRLSQGDSIAAPVYNANVTRTLPLSGSSFDEGNVANGGGCAVRTDNGRINLSESIRNGAFGTIPHNDDRKEFEIKYRINDGSDKSLNKLKVLVYWYNTMNDVPADLWQTLNDRQSQGVFLRGGELASSSIIDRTEQAAKPRPPCIIIIAN